MKVKLFDFESEQDLEEAINDFLEDEIELIDMEIGDMNENGIIALSDVISLLRIYLDN